MIVSHTAAADRSTARRTPMTRAGPVARAHDPRMTSDPMRWVEMAVVHRPNSTGIDLPAGASADDLASTDYHVLEMPDVGIEWAAVHRPNDVGIDLPAGACANDLASTDYHIVEMGEDDERG